MANSSLPPHLLTYRVEQRHERTGARHLLTIVASVLVLIIISNIIAPQMSFSAPMQGPIILGYNERYGPANTMHWGVDVGADAGSVVYTPVAGIISYVGTVPAAAGSGQKALAVTITTDQGHQVTLNPFAQTTLERNDRVIAGQSMGTLAGNGDLSSDRPHVHLSLRIDGKYRDPSSLVAATLQPSVTGISKTGEEASAVAPPLATPQPSPAPQIASPNTAQPRAEGTEASHNATAPAPASVPFFSSDEEVALAPLVEQVHADRSGASGSANTSSRSAPVRATDPTITAIPGVTLLDEEIPMSATSTSGALDRINALMLSRAQWALLLYAVGVILPCVLVGAWTIARKIGWENPLSTSLDMHLFAAREEK
ncbi:MAG: peptidoglycan DD-metalloendopeptidase family protein [Coriobacteriia bacterium]|nr:peptidoglycan DD-metalloendopeptidase family protein [Coriobacteriia bacterium]